ncbi:hypothetical protein BO71DRAFT_407340 [Aspergillus ellipticus CBS 707.79]|uniref:Uncharacterized protein n=1 Tax=Aspergillus ellipticus CBS 707.79 TaxID=1448320 RepID=A0A319DZR2_9EURO|nr:hypothetical protein BO71DRAFT_407340 [Aspergillus ellipticus CBS 707.79]
MPPRLCCRQEPEFRVESNPRPRDRPGSATIASEPCGQEREPRWERDPNQQRLAIATNYKEPARRFRLLGKPSPALPESMGRLGCLLWWRLAPRPRPPNQVNGGDKGPARNESSPGEAAIKKRSFATAVGPSYSSPYGVRTVVVEAGRTAKRGNRGCAILWGERMRAGEARVGDFPGSSGLPAFQPASGASNFVSDVSARERYFGRLLFSLGGFTWPSLMPHRAVDHCPVESVSLSRADADGAARGRTGGRRARRDWARAPRRGIVLGDLGCKLQTPSSKLQNFRPLSAGPGSLGSLGTTPSPGSNFWNAQPTNQPTNTSDRSTLGAPRALVNRSRAPPHWRELTGARGFDFAASRQSEAAQAQ